MRLLIASDAWHPQINGVVTTLTRLSADLAKLGVTSRFLTPNHFKTLPLPGYQTIRLALVRPSRIAAFVEAARADWIHIATEGPIGWATRRYCLLHDRAFTTSYHTKFPEYAARIAGLPAAWIYALERRFHHKSSGVMVATASLETDLRARGFKRLLRWSRGVDLDLFHPRTVRRFGVGPVFLYVGRVSREKNIEAFLDARLPGHKVVVGDGPYRPELCKRYADVLFAGAKFGQDLAEHYASADVFVFPSRTDTFGLVMLEAMASGLPVAAFPVTGPMDIVEHGVSGVLGEDLEAAACAALSLDPEAARARAAQFAWPQSAAEFLHNIEIARSAGVPNGTDRSRVAIGKIPINHSGKENMSTVDRHDLIDITRHRSKALVGSAVHHHSFLSRAGISERIFTNAFSGLVYPQIWEDPVVDIEAMTLTSGHHIVAIASGGCNILSYLTAAPVRITGVDLNTAHIALNRLKHAAIRHLHYADFHALFANAACARNAIIFDRRLSDGLDPQTKRYWTARDWRGRRRIDAFVRGFYRTGLLGRFITASHRLARLLGSDPAAIITARDLDEQRTIFEREIRPLLARPLVRQILNRRASLFGLGIPPAQYEALSQGRPMHEVIEERLERLACGFDIKDNYFAWQAFNRAYSSEATGPLPPYLDQRHYASLRERIGDVRILNVALTSHLAATPAQSIDRYVLLDAQDWMRDGDLVALWQEITRTARADARVIFRTAGTQTILPGRVPQQILEHWDYALEQSKALTLRDRSAIYGGFHLYIRKP